MTKLYEMINENNWRKVGDGKGEWSPGVGCILTHIGDATDKRVHLIDEAVLTLFPERVRIKRSEWRISGVRTVKFNDHPDTTLEDVLRVCKLADV